MSRMSRGRQDAAFESKDVDGSRSGSRWKASTFCSPFPSVVDCNRCALGARCKQSWSKTVIGLGVLFPFGECSGKTVCMVKHGQNFGVSLCRDLSVVHICTLHQC